MESKSESLLSKFTSFLRIGADDEDGEYADSLPARESLRELVERKQRDDIIRGREFKQLRKIIGQRRLKELGTDGHAGDEGLTAPSSDFGTPPQADNAPALPATALADWWGAGSHQTPLGGDVPMLPDEGVPSEDLDLDFTTLLSPPPNELTPDPDAGAKPDLPASAAQFAPAERNRVADAGSEPHDAPDQSAPASSMEWTLVPIDSETPQPDNTPKTSASAAQARADVQAQAQAQAQGRANAAAAANADALAKKKAAAAQAEQDKEAKRVAAADTSLRKAAISYSAGDYAAAEGHLLAALKVDALGVPLEEMLTFTLLDIYRATGQHDRFENAAMEYAQRSGRSPAEWFSLPEQMAQLAKLEQQEMRNRQATAPDALHSPPPGATGSVRWQCPPVLDSAAISALQGMNRPAQTLSHIDWSVLQRIDIAVGPALAGLLRHWCSHKLELKWSGTESLVGALALHTQQAPEREEELWWRMHMDLLCILTQPDNFETLALDYCVAFEVSPPSWEDARCTVVVDPMNDSMDFTQPSALKIAPVTSATTASSDAPALAADKEAKAIDKASDLAPGGPIARGVLRGDLMGEDAAELRRLPAPGSGTGSGKGTIKIISVSCGQLRRIDFAATKTLMAWAQKMTSQGIRIQFTQVPRLVLVFMLMKGLDQYVGMSTRPN